MTIRIILFFVLVFPLTGKTQTNCDALFLKDTMSLPETSKIIDGDYLETTLKDFSQVRLFKTTNNKYYLKFIVKRNFYFDKVDVLEIRSGSKSYYAKDTKQYKIDKTTGMFIIEVFKNYISTLKEEGITSLYFSQAETKFTRHDTKQIKQIANCFYNSIALK